MLRASETRYRELFDNTSSGVAIYEVKDGGKDFILKDFNKAGERIDGARKDDIIGKSIHEVQPGIKEFGLLDVFERVWRTGIPEHHAASFCNDQKITAWYENFVYKLPTGEMVDVYDDITDRMRAEEALRESEQRLSQIFDFLPDATFAIDLNGKVIAWNRAIEEMTGVKAEQIMGRGDHEYGLHFYGIRRPMLVDLVLTFDEEIKNKYHFVKKEGDVLLAEGDAPVRGEQSRALWGKARPLYDSEGNIVGAIEAIRDITERKRSQDELFDSRQMLRSVLDNIPQRVFWKDRNSVYVGCNKPFVLDCGYEDPGELVGKTAYDHASAALADIYRADDREVMGSGRPKINYEQLQIRPDGSQAWVITSKVPMYDKVGQVIGVLGTYADITERKLMEEEIRQTNAYLENIFDNSPDSIAIVDSYGRFIRWNKMAEALHGYTFEDMKGKSAFDLYANKDELKKLLMSLRREGSVKKWEMRMQRKDGSSVPLEMSIGLLKDNQNRTLGSVCVARDLSGIKEAFSALKASHEQLYQEIAERKQAEETLERLRRHNELILNSAGEGILGLGPDGRHTFVNPAATGMLRYMANELIGRKGHGLYHHAREDGGAYPEEDCPIFQALRDGKFCQVTEEVFWRKDGTSFPVRYSCAPIIEEGEVVGAVVTFSDITVYKRGEKERKKLEEQLFQAQKMESVGRLAGGVAHDFNNMLSVIIGRAEMALQQSVSNDKLQQNIREILKAGLRSADLTRQLLAFARKQTAIPKIMDLNETISGILKMLRRLIGEDIDLLWAPGLDLWKVKIDPSQVDQILANLAVNARDAIFGVGAVTMRTENIVVDDSHRAETPELIPGDYVLLTVSDTGAGMNKEVRENIFEPFFTTKEVGKGTGLGLSTVYGIVKQNDGFIYVASEPGEGTTFRIYLPRFEAETAQVPSEHVAVLRPTGTETILLVEDDEAILNLGKIILENLGYTVLAARTPGHAIHLAEEHPGDIRLLITDVVMPEMHGRELAEKLSAIRPNLKCLYMSGYTADVIAHRGILDEGLNFIQKPFGGDDLAARVRQMLDHLE
jgi:PAS domain S-box-containing protein